jgi:hypothetical protein
LNPLPQRFRELGTKRRHNAAGERVARVVWLLISLFEGAPVEYATYLRRFGVDRRTFQRDLQAVREISAQHGCTIAHTKGGRVFLEPEIGTTSSRSGKRWNKALGHTLTLIMQKR